MSHTDRVTIDIDSKVPHWRLRAIRAYYALERFAERVDVTISSSGKGIHLEGWLSERLDDEERDAIRRHLGDDPARIVLDGQRRRVGGMTNVLWTEKDGRRSDGDFGNLWDALDHIEMTTE